MPGSHRQKKNRRTSETKHRSGEHEHNRTLGRKAIPSLTGECQFAVPSQLELTRPQLRLSAASFGSPLRPFAFEFRISTYSPGTYSGELYFLSSLFAELQVFRLRNEKELMDSSFAFA